MYKIHVPRLSRLRNYVDRCLVQVVEVGWMEGGREGGREGRERERERGKDRGRDSAGEHKPYGDDATPSLPAVSDCLSVRAAKNR